MKKKAKSQNNNSPFTKFILLAISVFVLGLVVYNLAEDAFTRSPYFRVKMIVLDPSLQFINKNDLVYLIGKNVFTIDLKEVQRKLGYKYPQIAQLRIVKNYPDQILIQAKKRFALAQVMVRRRIAVVDEQGMVLMFLHDIDSTLPAIKGINDKGIKIELGFPITGQDLVLALKIIKAYEDHKILAAYPIMDIEIENPSKIEMTIINNLKIIIDQEKIEQRMNVLVVLLSQAKLDFEKIKYLDLRFQEPIIGQK